MIGAAQGRVGRALLVRYNDMVLDVSEVVKAIRSCRGTAILKVIARGAKTVEELSGRTAGDAPSLHCPPLTHIRRAVVAFRRGRNISALAAARAALERAVFKHEGANDEDLADADIDPREWKSLAVRCLLKANAITTTGTYFDWNAQVGKMLDEGDWEFHLGLSSLREGKAKAEEAGRMGHAGRRFPASAERWPSGSCWNSWRKRFMGLRVRLTTSPFSCARTTNATHCPSAVWWSTERQTPRREAYRLRRHDEDSWRPDRLRLGSMLQATSRLPRRVRGEL